jgi:hypothetical protein
MEQQQHAEVRPRLSLSTLLTSEALHQRLHPDLTVGSWRNWLKLAIKGRAFPEGIRVGDRAVLWSEAEVISWLESRPRGGRFDGRRRTRGSRG